LATSGRATADRCAGGFERSGKCKRLSVERSEVSLVGRPYSHSIVLRHGNALICPRKFFPPATKNRLRDPSEICAIDFKHEFRRFAICSVSATIGIDWPICDLRSDRAPSAPRQKTPSPVAAGASLGSWQGRNHHNFNEHPRSPKVGREASPHRRGLSDRPTRSKQNCDLRTDACQRSRPGR
jgi:hypothetical protein